MSRAALIVLVLASGCSVALGSGGPTLKHVNRMGLGATVLTIACDWGQTHASAARGWDHQHEANPIMGRRPSTNTVDLYMASVLVGTVVGWRLLPPRLRPLLYVPVLAVQVDSIRNNLGTTPGLCGVVGDPVR